METGRARWSVALSQLQASRHASFDVGTNPRERDRLIDFVHKLYSYCILK